MLVGKDCCAGLQVAQQLLTHRRIGSLAGGEFQPNRSAICIDKMHGLLSSGRHENVP
jgi:hypothetical protein